MYFARHDVVVGVDRTVRLLEGPAVNRIPMQTYSAKLSYYSVVLDSVSALNCRSCRSPLDIHQPSPIHPNQFLGTCTECGCWYRVAALTENGQILVLKLPELEEINPPSSAKSPKG